LGNAPQNPTKATHKNHPSYKRKPQTDQWSTVLSKFPHNNNCFKTKQQAPWQPLPPSLSPTHPHLQQQQETWTCHLEQSAQAVPDFVALWTPPYLARKRHSTGRGATHKFPTNLQHRNTHRNKQPPKMQAEKYQANTL